MTLIDLESDLLNYIIAHNFNPGDRLPTITELQKTDHLGISASKIREQLEVARALGLVEVRSRTGMRLKDYTFTPAVRLSLMFALAHDPRSFHLFSELRTHVETAFWNEACELLHDEDKQAMRKCIAEAHKKLNAEWIRIPNAEHRQFHLTVFKRLENPFVIGILEAYWESYDAVQLNTYADFAYHQSVWQYHARILDAIEHGDYDTAKTLFIEHTQLLRYQSRILPREGGTAEEHIMD